MLFSENTLSKENTSLPKAPLSERMRPQSLSEVIGQEHLLGPEGLLTQMLANNHLPSIILWGPPGVGKTTIAKLLAKALNRPFTAVSAIQVGVQEVRKIIAAAEFQKGMVLFLDEIHRFNKSQQDALLKAVEEGTITLIGATTENPSLEINNALLSRCRVMMLNPLSEEAAKQIVQNALEKDDVLSTQIVEISEWEALLSYSSGDGRHLLNLLESVVESIDKVNKVITNQQVARIAQRKVPAYDKTGENHYDIISAFIKSVRGSDPNAAVYWLARMIDGGEDAMFIARRLIILASEDIGNANPTGLVIATSAAEAIKNIGMPEGRIILSQATIYLACSPKSNASYTAIDDALALVRKTGDLPVPLHLRNAPTKLMKDIGYGKDYLYPHNYEGNFTQQQYLPDTIKGSIFYQPKEASREKDFLQKLRDWWKGVYKY